MAKKHSDKPPLSLVGPDTTIGKPPRTLGKHGRSLWDRIQSEYDVSDAAGTEMLGLAAQALDRAESLREEIDRDGEVIRSRGVIKDHPALKHELACRAFVVRTLTKLGLNYEPVRASAGRPGGGLGWTGPA